MARRHGFGRIDDEASGAGAEAAVRRRPRSRPAAPAPGGPPGAPVPANAARHRHRPRGPAAPAGSAAAPRGPPQLVAVVALGVGAVAGVVVGGLAGVLDTGTSRPTPQARDQHFVDTATQTVVNMFSYNQNNIDESVNRFVNGTSGPLRGHDEPGQQRRQPEGAVPRHQRQLGGRDQRRRAGEASTTSPRTRSVLVSVRVTVTDLDGVNKPSQPYRMRVIVHEDDNGHMTGYDLKYPEGGN